MAKSSLFKRVGECQSSPGSVLLVSLVHTGQWPVFGLLPHRDAFSGDAIGETVTTKTNRERR